MGLLEHGLHDLFFGVVPTAQLDGFRGAHLRAFPMKGALAGISHHSMDTSEFECSFWTSNYTRATTYALAPVVKFLYLKRETLWIMAPFTGERATLEKDRHPHSRSIINRVAFNIKKESHPADI